MKYWDKKTVERLRKGFYSAVYFNRTKYILEQEKDFTPVTMQIFQWNEASTLCGVDEVIELLKVAADKPNTLSVNSLRDGDSVRRGESVMHITGPYVFLPILSQSIWVSLHDELL